MILKQILGKYGVKTLTSLKLLRAGCYYLHTPITLTYTQKQAIINRLYELSGTTTAGDSSFVLRVNLTKKILRCGIG
jgi:hypothetical protein